MTIEELYYKHASHKTGPCKYWTQNEEFVQKTGDTRPGVECDSLSKCESCGWNPEIKKKRLENLKCP